MKTGRTWLSAIGAGALLALAHGPALALDDDGHQSIFQTFTGLVKNGIGIAGLGSNDEKAPIRYRERAPLVLPPSNNLRTPMPPVGARNAAWPKDYDAERVRRARAPAREVLRDDAGNEIVSTRYLRNTGRLARSPQRDPVAEDCANRGPLDQPCDIQGLWRTLKNAKKNDTSKDLVPGQEPPRTALTDPPAGLRTPSTRQKYSFEAEERKPDVPDPREAIREEARRDREYR